MAKKFAYERYLWFHSRLKAGKYPRISDLAGKVSLLASARRDARAAGLSRRAGSAA